MVDIETPRWTFLSTHAHVLLAIAADPDVRLRDLASMIGITERTAMGIVTDLDNAGYITRTKVGRRNHYKINRRVPLRHPLEAHHHIDELIDAVSHN